MKQSQMGKIKQNQLNLQTDLAVSVSLDQS